MKTTATAPFVIERVYHAPVERVWEAITDKEKMKQWYFDIKNFRQEIGFEFEFEAGDKDKRYRHLCKVMEVVTNRKLKYSWKYDGYEGNSFVSFELFREGDKTRLRLTHEGLETFPPITNFARKNFEKGWTDLIGSLLKDFLENSPKR